MTQTTAILTDSDIKTTPQDKDALLREFEEIKEKAPDLVTSDPDAALKLIRDWQTRAEACLEARA